MQEQIEISPKARWWTLIALSGSLALAFLDQTNLPVALPTIQKQLNISSLVVQWLINAYLLSWAVFVLTGGYLADQFGLRRVFCAGVLIFGLGSLGSAFAYWGAWFIAARAVEGFGTALMLPSAIGILVSIYPKKEQGKAIGIYSGIASIFLVLGPLMGGFFTQFLSWRWIFIVNTPLVLLSYFIIIAKLPKIIPNKKKFDVWGFIFFTLGFPCFILGLMQGNKWGWGHWAIITFFSVSLFSLIVFFIIEVKTKISFLDLSLFKERSFLGSNLIFFVIQFILILPVYWAMFLQKILKYDPLTAGLYVMVAVVPLVIIIPLGGILSDFKGHRFPVIVGLFLTLASLIWFFLMYKMNVHILVPGMILFGAGIALVFAPISSCVVGEVPPDKRGIASGVLGCIRQVGGTIGMAAISAMLFNIRGHHFYKNLKNSPFSDVEVTESQLECFYNGSSKLCEVSEGTLTYLKSLAIDSYFLAFRWIYLMCASLVFIALIVSWKTIDRKTTQNKSE